MSRRRRHRRPWEMTLWKLSWGYSASSEYYFEEEVLRVFDDNHYAERRSLRPSGC